MNSKSPVSDTTLNIIAIKTKHKVYISDNIQGKSYFSSQLGNKYFDGELPIKSYVEGWYSIKSIPTKIEKIVSGQKINKRYELREQFPVSDMTPKIIEEDYIDEDSEYYSIRGLYEFKYDVTEETKEEVGFNITILDEIENFEPIKEEFKIQYNLIDKLKTHPVLLHTKPCKLTHEESYQIIRNYIKQNINYTYANITSDYDFCFTVKKKIKFTEAESYQVNVGKRKPKYETRYRKFNEITIFEVAPKAYQSYTIVTPFEGKNYEDLKKNIDDYLTKLIVFINEPVVECPHCNGMGVIQDKFVQK